VPPRSWQLRVEDILGAIAKIRRYVDGLSREEFAADEKTVDAVVRNLEVIGEAARAVPAEARTRSPQVPWTEMTGLRNKVTHEYFGVDPAIIWQTIADDLEPVVPALQSLLGSAPDT